jgi:PhoPQ-activated pathogenicity-related protein
LDIPAFFIAGKKDKLVAPHHVYTLYKKYKGSKSLAIIEGASHNGKRPDYVQNDIKQFLNFVFNSKDSDRLILATVEDVFKKNDRKKSSFDILFNRKSRTMNRSGMRKCRVRSAKKVVFVKKGKKGKVI